MRIDGVEKEIQLLESKPLFYLVKYFDYNQNEGFAREFGKIFASKRDAHYVLIEKVATCLKGEPDLIDVFGVAHTEEEADGRLYTRAKKCAERMAREHEVRSLEDRTRHYQQSPRDGK